MSLTGYIQNKLVKRAIAAVPNHVDIVNGYKQSLQGPAHHAERLVHHLGSEDAARDVLAKAKALSLTIGESGKMTDPFGKPTDAGAAAIERDTKIACEAVIQHATAHAATRAPMMAKQVLIVSGVAVLFLVFALSPFGQELMREQAAKRQAIGTGR